MMFGIKPNMTQAEMDRRKQVIGNLTNNMGNANGAGAGFAQMLQGMIAGRQMKQMDGMKPSPPAAAPASAGGGQRPAGLMGNLFGPDGPFSRGLFSNFRGR